jgi:hypothetical protein
MTWTILFSNGSPGLGVPFTGRQRAVHRRSSPLLLSVPRTNECVWTGGGGRGRRRRTEALVVRAAAVGGLVTPGRVAGATWTSGHYFIYLYICPGNRTNSGFVVLCPANILINYSILFFLH